MQVCYTKPYHYPSSESVFQNPFYYLSLEATKWSSNYFYDSEVVRHLALF